MLQSLLLTLFYLMALVSLLTQLEARNLAFITVGTMFKHKKNSLSATVISEVFFRLCFTIHTIQITSISSHFLYFPLGNVFTKPEFQVQVMARLQSHHFQKGFQAQPHKISHSANSLHPIAMEPCAKSPASETGAGSRILTLPTS